MSYRIGAFSRITQLSPKALRLYHEKGLLVPADTDPESGYRLYNDADIERARVIRALKDLRLPLASIGEILNHHREDSELVQFLGEHREKIRSELLKLQSIERDIDAMIAVARGWDSALDSSQQVQEIELEPLLYAGLRRRGPFEDLRLSFKAVGRAAGFKIGGPATGLFYDEAYVEDGADFEGGFPLRRAIDSLQLDCRELPGGRALSLLHVGPYDTICASYARVMKRAVQLDVRTLLPSREVYHKGPGLLFRGNPNKYRTETQLLLAPAGGP